MTRLERRGWVPGVCEDYIQRIAADAAWADADAVAARIAALIEQNHAIHDRDCINLNPATNVNGGRSSFEYLKRLVGVICSSKSIARIGPWSACFAVSALGSPIAPSRRRSMFAMPYTAPVGSPLELVSEGIA